MNREEARAFQEEYGGQIAMGSMLATIPVGLRAVVKSMQADQRLWNSSGGTEGKNWSADARGMDRKLGNASKSVKAAVSTAVNKADAASKTRAQEGRVKQLRGEEAKIKSDAAKQTASVKKAEARRAREQKGRVKQLRGEEDAAARKSSAADRKQRTTARRQNLENEQSERRAKEKAATRKAAKSGTEATEQRRKENQTKLEAQDAKAEKKRLADQNKKATEGMDEIKKKRSQSVADQMRKDAQTVQDKKKARNKVKADKAAKTKAKNKVEARLNEINTKIKEQYNLTDAQAKDLRKKQILSAKDPLKPTEAEYAKYSKVMQSKPRRTVPKKAPVGVKRLGATALATSLASGAGVRGLLGGGGGDKDTPKPDKYGKYDSREDELEASRSGIADFASDTAGWGTLGAAAVGGAYAGGSSLQSRYDLEGNRGLSKTGAYGEALRDTGGLVKDYAKGKVIGAKENVNKVKKWAGYDTTLADTKARAERTKLKKVKEGRFKDPDYDKYVAENKAKENIADYQEKAAAKAANSTKDTSGSNKPGEYNSPRHEVVRNGVNEAIASEQRSMKKGEAEIQRLQDRIATSSGADKTAAEAELKKANQRARFSAAEVERYTDLRKGIDGISERQLAKQWGDGTAKGAGAGKVNTGAGHGDFREFATGSFGTAKETIKQGAAAAGEAVKEGAKKAAEVGGRTMEQALAGAKQAFGEGSKGYTAAEKKIKKEFAKATKGPGFGQKLKRKIGLSQTPDAETGPNQTRKQKKASKAQAKKDAFMGQDKLKNMSQGRKNLNYKLRGSGGSSMVGPAANMAAVALREDSMNPDNPYGVVQTAADTASAIPAAMTDYFDKYDLGDMRGERDWIGAGVGAIQGIGEMAIDAVPYALQGGYNIGSNAMDRLTGADNDRYYETEYTPPENPDSSLEEVFGRWNPANYGRSDYSQQQWADDYGIALNPDGSVADTNPELVPPENPTNNIQGTANTDASGNIVPNGTSDAAIQQGAEQKALEKPGAEGIDLGQKAGRGATPEGMNYTQYDTENASGNQRANPVYSYRNPEGSGEMIYSDSPAGAQMMSDMDTMGAEQAQAQMLADPSYELRSNEIAGYNAAQTAAAQAEQERQAGILAKAEGKGDTGLTFDQQVKLAELPIDQRQAVSANLSTVGGKTGEQVRGLTQYDYANKVGKQGGALETFQDPMNVVRNPTDWWYSSDSRQAEAFKPQNVGTDRGYWRDKKSGDVKWRQYNDKGGVANTAELDRDTFMSEYNMTEQDLDQYVKRRNY